MSEVNAPENWARATVLDLVYSRGRIGWKGLKANEYKEQGPYFVSVREFIPDGTIRWSHCAHITKVRYDESPEIMLKKGDILLCKDGSTIGKVAFVTHNPGEATVNSSIAVVTPHNGIEPRYIYYYFKGPVFQNLVESRIMGAAIPHIFQKDLRSLEINLPPNPEQKRIVQKIESCFEKIDATEVNLNKVETLLEKYRESLLAKAFRGELVPQDPKDESASVLLEKIRKERSENQKGKKSDQDFGPITEDEKPFELPFGWEWVRFEEITENLDGKRVPIKSTDRKTTKGTYPYYGASGIIDYVDDYIFDGEHLLISEDGANLLARTYPISFIAAGKFWVNNHAHIVKALSATSNRFLELYFESLDISRWVTGAAQPKFNQAKLNSVPIPLPPLKEQERILALLDNRFNLHKQLATELSKKQTIIPKLRESILQKAFEGRLVEQIPSEGTGHELLAKILAEKDISQKPDPETKTKKTIKKKTPAKAVTPKGKKNGKK